MPLSDYLPKSDELPDQFELRRSPADQWQFPCCRCKHRIRPCKECEGCAHYI